MIHDLYDYKTSSWLILYYPTFGDKPVNVSSGSLGSSGSLAASMTHLKYNLTLHVRAISGKSFDFSKSHNMRYQLDFGFEDYESREFNFIHLMCNDFKVYPNEERFDNAGLYFYCENIVLDRNSVYSTEDIDLREWELFRNKKDFKNALVRYLI